MSASSLFLYDFPASDKPSKAPIYASFSHRGHSSQVSDGRKASMSRIMAISERQENQSISKIGYRGVGPDAICHLMAHLEPPSSSLD